MLALLLLLAQVTATPPRPDSSERLLAIARQAHLDTGVINFRALVLPDTVYVGQQATYELGIFVDERVRDRVRRMEAVAPEMRTMLAYDAPVPTADIAYRTEGSRRYEVHIYQRPIFPLAPGRFTIPPAHLSYSMPLSFSFFSREENFELPSDSAVIVAIEPPVAARPPDYSGAVGTFDIDAQLDTGAARVGEPMSLSVRVSGVGNMKLLPRPHVSLSWASLVPAGERVSIAPDPAVVRGSKEFDWVVTPLKSGPAILPAIRYSYFDPVHARYAVAQTTPATVTIAMGHLAAVDTAPRATPQWPVRTEYHGALPEPPYRRTPFWMLVFLAPLPAAVLFVARRPRRSRRRTHAPASALRAFAHGRDAQPTARAVRLEFLRAIAERIRVPASAVAEPEALERALRRAGTSRETASGAAVFIGELNAAAFSAEPHTMLDAAGRAYRLFRAIDAEARRFHVPRSATGLVVALVIAATGAWALAAPASESVRFAQGVEAYDHGRYREAADHFAWITERVPRAADAWANLGTAAWASGDTARAALGWEQALRLQPTARDARERLDRVLPTTGVGPGAVPPVPAAVVALLAAALWIGGWLVQAERLLRRRRGTAIALGLVGAGVLFAVTAVQLDARLSTRGLGVVAANSSLHLLPLLGAEATGTVRIGEVTRVLERRGVWTHVSATDARDGWIPATSLLPLDRD